MSVTLVSDQFLLKDTGMQLVKIKALQALEAWAS